MTSSPPKSTSPKGGISPVAGTSPRSTTSPGAAPQSLAAEPAFLEADTVPEDNDSALDVGSEGGSASLASSILKYRVENGRTYHAFKAGSYILPNDEIENERLDLQHHICVVTTDNKLYTCPAGKEGAALNRVLDAGCGTGIWTMDFADEHPEAQVIGVDLSPIQPNFVPPNVTFYVDDIEAEWTYSAPFDFIYMRMLSASIRDWPRLFGNAFANISPGGWIELLDPVYPMDCDDGTLPHDSALYKWSVLMNEAATKLGSGIDSALSYRTQLAEAGFVNVVERTYKWPMNTWPREPRHKELGAWTHENIMQGLQALSLALFTRALGWKPEELELFLVDVRRQLRDRSIHGYWRIVVVYGQKPE